MAGEIKKLSFPDGVIVDEPTDIDLFGTGTQEIAITEWVSYTPVITAATTDPTPANDHTLTGSWRRIGDTMEVAIAYNHDSLTGAASGSGNYYFSLPAGYNIDASKLAFNSNDTFGDAGSIVGGNAYVRVGGSFYHGTPHWQPSLGTNRLGMIVGNSAFALSNASHTYTPMASSSSTQYQISAILPIVEFSGNPSSLVGFTTPTDTTIGLAGPSGKVAIPSADADLSGFTIVNDIDFHYSRSGDVFFVTGYAFINSHNADFTKYIRIPFADIPFLVGSTVNAVHGVAGINQFTAANGIVNDTNGTTEFNIEFTNLPAETNRRLYFTSSIYVGS